MFLIDVIPYQIARLSTKLRVEYAPVEVVISLVSVSNDSSEIGFSSNSPKNEAASEPTVTGSPDAQS